MANANDRFDVRIFPDDETTSLVYENVTHVFLEGNNTILTICDPDKKRHHHWPLSRVRHYTVIDRESKG